MSEVRRFLGLTGWFRNFIKDYAGLTSNLTDFLSGKDVKWKWTEDMESDPENVKTALKNMSKLQIANYNKDFLLRTDASKVWIGAVLLQKDKNDEWVPVQWA